MEHRDNRPFGCNICELRFTTRQFLQRHFIVHTEKRSFKCIFCDNSYKYKKGLNRHYKKIHSEYYITEIASKYDNKFKIPLAYTSNIKKTVITKHKKAYIDDEEILIFDCDESNFLTPIPLDASKIFVTSPFPISS